MTKRTTNVLKGAAGGAAVGLMMGYLGKNAVGSKKDIKKKAGKAMESLSNVMDTVAYLFK